MFPLHRRINYGSGSFTFNRAAVRPFVIYLIKAHMRRQYLKLYSSYQRVLVATERTSLNGKDLDELDAASTYIKNYAETLPNSRRITLGIIGGALAIVGILSGIITIFGLQPTTTFSQLMTPQVTGLIVGIIIIVVLLVMSVGGFMLDQSFRFKRKVFLRANTIYPLDDVFIYGVEPYDESTYFLENRLFNLLSSQSKKEKEFPYDVLFTIGSVLPGVLLYGTSAILMTYMDISGTVLTRTDVQVFAGMVLSFITFVAWVGIATPVIGLIKRYRLKLM